MSAAPILLSWCPTLSDFDDPCAPCSWPRFKPLVDQYGNVLTGSHFDLSQAYDEDGQKISDHAYGYFAIMITGNYASGGTNPFFDEPNTFVSFEGLYFPVTVSFPDNVSADCTLTWYVDGIPYIEFFINQAATYPGISQSISQKILAPPTDVTLPGAILAGFDFIEVVPQSSRLADGSYYTPPNRYTFAQTTYDNGQISWWMQAAIVGFTRGRPLGVKHDLICNNASISTTMYRSDNTQYPQEIPINPIFYGIHF